jgi:hypothetical protein
MRLLRVVGIVTAATVALAVVWNFPDIRRYIKIEMM